MKQERFPQFSERTGSPRWPPMGNHEGASQVLVHSMSFAGKFEEQDRIAAQNFAAAARESGVQRITYMGGLGEVGPSLSSHLRSRQEVGELLRQ